MQSECYLRYLTQSYTVGLRNVYSETNNMCGSRSIPHTDVVFSGCWLILFLGTQNYYWVDNHEIISRNFGTTRVLYGFIIHTFAYIYNERLF